MNSEVQRSGHKIPIPEVVPCVDVRARNEELERAFLDAGRVFRYLEHSSEHYAYFSDDPHLVAAKSLAFRLCKKLERLKSE